MKKYIGITAAIIYQDRKGQITQRHILVRSVTKDVIHSYDLDKKALRTFDIDRILAMQPVSRYAS